MYTAFVLLNIVLHHDNTQALQNVQMQNITIPNNFYKTR